MYVYTCIYTYIYIHTQIYMYIHVHVDIFGLPVATRLTLSTPPPPTLPSAGPAQDPEELMEKANEALDRILTSPHIS